MLFQEQPGKSNSSAGTLSPKAHSSFYFHNTRAEVDRFVEEVKKIQKFFATWPVTAAVNGWLTQVHFDVNLARCVRFNSTGPPAALAR